jgi:outer membrane biogenesis lipoprotein LolB
LAPLAPEQSESIEEEQVRHTVERDAAPQRVRSENMQWSTGGDVPLGHLAQGSQSSRIDEHDIGAIDEDVLIRAERVERGTKQWGSDHVNLAPHDDNRHVVDMKPVNLQTLIEHRHCHLFVPC